MDAVDRRMAQLQRGLTAAQRDRLKRVRVISRDFRRNLTGADRERIRTADDWLYNEKGLPR